MAVKTNAELIAAFATGQKPTGAWFASLIESKFGESGQLKTADIPTGLPLFTKVAITATWATPANAKTDIESATGMTFPADTAKNDIFVTLWEGAGDADDFAVLYVGDTPAYLAPNGLASTWVSAPVAGTAYIVSITLNKVN